MQEHSRTILERMDGVQKKQVGTVDRRGAEPGV